MSAAERWVVLGVAPVRTAWFTDLARWSTSGVVPVEFVKCLSTDEVASRLQSGRPHSALLADGRCPGLDRDLLHQASAAGCASIVVGALPSAWPGDDVASLPDGFDRTQLLQALQRHAHPIDQVVASAARATTTPATWRGRLVGVTGARGSGCSTTSMALAQGLARDARLRGELALVDLALDADLGVLHDAREVLPALQELVEAHRTTQPGPTRVRSMLYADPRRGYDLLLGLRRHRDWTALRPRAVAATVEGLVQAYRVVVAEVEPDLEDEQETGSFDVEERNALARAVAERADLMVVVGRPDVQGLHRLARTLSNLVESGVPGERLQPVVVGTSRRRAERAQVAAALAGLVSLPADEPGIASPVHVPHRSQVERSVHDGTPLPEPVTRAITGAVVASLDRLEPRPRRRGHASPVPTGRVGHWADAAGGAR